MTAYRITPATSFYTDVFRDHAFDADSAGPDTLTVDAGAFLVANRLGIGAYLEGTGAWTVSVAGSVVSTYEEGMLLAPGADGSRNTVGAEGSVSGKIGITVVSAATVENAGTIVGTTFYGVQVDKGATHTIINTGTIEAPIAIGDSLGLAVDSVTNTGTLAGGVCLSGGADTLVNGGAVTGDVGLGDGADVMTNFVTRAGATVSGSIADVIDLGAGNDRFSGGAGAERVQDGEGADRYLATGNAGADGADTVVGGAGIDTYDASASTVPVGVNLDAAAHGLGPVSTSGGTMAAQTATGSAVAGASLDRITGFENAAGGAAGDRLHGSGAANVLDGNGGADMLFGYGGDDTLSGGASFDNLVGGAGRDALTGGSEADSFDFAAGTDSGITTARRDVITDFEDVLDVINLAAIDADSTSAGNGAFAFVGMHAAFIGHAGELRAIFSGTGEVVEADTNGDGIADFSIGLRDSSHSIVLSAADFIL